MNPPIRWLGGKTRQYKNLAPIFATIRRSLYCEPFGGSGAVFCAKEPERHEIYNDLNGLLVNLFRQFRRGDCAREFRELASRSPMSREIWRELRDVCRAYVDQDANAFAEYCRAANFGDYEPNVVAAFAFFYCQNCGFGGKVLNAFGGGDKGDRLLEISYRNAAELIDEHCRRFARVVIENLDAFECLKKYDAPTSFFYVDPPYDVSCSDSYGTGWTTETTARLVSTLREIEGSVVVSCYDDPVYKTLRSAGYIKRDFDAFSSVCAVAAGDEFRRTETVYVRLSEPARAALEEHKRKTFLFDID